MQYYLLYVLRSRLYLRKQSFSNVSGCWYYCIFITHDNMIVPGYCLFISILTAWNVESCHFSLSITNTLPLHWSTTSAPERWNSCLPYSDDCSIKSEGILQRLISNNDVWWLACWKRCDLCDCRSVTEPRKLHTSRHRFYTDNIILARHNTTSTAQ